MTRDSLTNHQLDHYRNKGYVTVPGFFTEAEVRTVEDYLVANQGVKAADKSHDPLREAHYHHRGIYGVCTLPRLLDVVEQILGPDIVLLYSHILSKPAGGMGVAWHQDGPYWPRIEPKVAVTAYMAIDDANPENGCLRVIPGSHAGCVDYGQKLTDKPDLIQDHAVALPEGIVDENKSEDVLLKRGDLSLHHSYIIHGSEPNCSHRRRAAFTIRYVPATTRIQPREDRKQYLVRGQAAGNGNPYFQFGLG